MASIHLCVKKMLAAFSTECSCLVVSFHCFSCDVISLRRFRRYRFYRKQAKRRWMSPSATPATQSESRCRQVPRLPRKVPRRHRRLSAPKRATRSSPVPQVSRLPRKTEVDVTKCHTCQAKRRWMSPRATPATQSAAASPATSRAQARHQIQPSAASATPAHATRR